MFHSFQRFYKNSLPVSHFISTLIVSILSLVLLTSGLNALMERKDNFYIEGVIMGVDENGNILPLNRINPLVNSNIQLESDLSEIIYDSLIKIDQKGNAQPKLADFFTIEKGKRYQFRLKENLFWSDGTPITSEDVAKTFELIKTLEGRSQTSSLYSKAANKIDLVKSDDDDRTFEFIVQGDNVIPGFFEAISFKVLPAHLITDITVDNILTSDPVLNRRPVGSGPFKLSMAGDGYVDLVANKLYSGEAPQIQKIRFKFFSSEKSAYDALISGQIHGLAGISEQYVNGIEDDSMIAKYVSNTIYNQYWALYFNLNADGPAIFKDIKFRKAVNLAINRERMITDSEGLLEEAKGPIPPSSFAYLSTAKTAYDVEAGKKLLNELGYSMNSDGFMTKGTDNLSFEVVLVKNSDRESQANHIKDDLKQIGIDIRINSLDLTTALEQYIIPRNYEMLLYGVQTFIDPDRYELFHSSQILHPGLNFAGYVSSTQRTQVVDGKTTKVSAVDDDLFDGRRLVDETARIKKYDDFQKVINAEIPEIFLFYPKEVYLVNKRIINIELASINSVSERFESLNTWTTK
jgi:peptide/nickel transport system substrate-binding protein